MLEERRVLSGFIGPQLFHPADLQSGSTLPAPTVRPILPAWFESFSDELAAEDQWLIQLAGGIADQLNSAAAARNLFLGSGIDIVRGLGMQGWLLASSSNDPVSVAGWLGSQSFVASFERNQVFSVAQTPNDTAYSQLWGLHNTGQTGGSVDADIDAPEAWDLFTGNSQVVVGIIDTGVDYNHPDLAANIWTNPGEIAGNFIDDDQNGFVDDVHGYNFVYSHGNPMDDHRHGTHVAGTIAGVGHNGAGVVGVNWSSSIMALKFLNAAGSGYTSDAMRAVNYATMMKNSFGVNLRLTNNSWGGGGYSQALYDAINANGAAGALFIAAAGNDGLNNDSYLSYPASYALSNIISVAATDRNDFLANFSNYGVTTVDIAAPGVDIHSTLLNNTYGLLSGTSMATPHVAGVAALAWAYTPSSTPTEIRNALFGGVDPKSWLTNQVATGGRLNARRTLELLGMAVKSSHPAKDAIVNSPPTSFTINFTHAYLPASVDAADLTIAGVPATSVIQVDADTLTFVFDASPVTSQGSHTVQIAAGALARLFDSDPIDAWQSTFFYDALPLAIVASSPAGGAVLGSAPAAIELDFNEAVDAASVQAADLVLDYGAVTGVTIVDADTLRFAVSGLIRDGAVRYTLAPGALLDNHRNPSPALSGSFNLDDPLVTRHAATDVPKNIPDAGLATSTITFVTPITIADLDVEISLNHPFAADLDVFLVAPDGTRVELFSDVGGSGDNFAGTILDDEGVTPIAQGNAPFTARFKPVGSLASFDGYNTLGSWALQVTDDTTTNTGSIVGWTMIVASDVDIAPRISSVQPLVASGVTWAAMSTLTVRFSEIMDAATVNNIAHWSLVGAGADATFGTADDTSHALTLASAYVTGLNATLNIAGGPLAPGEYRFTGSGSLRDSLGNALDGNADGIGGDAFLRSFTVKPSATLPVQETFETGSIGALPGHWEFAAGPSGRITVGAGAGGAHGGSHYLLLDQTAAYAGPQFATLHLDLQGKTQVTLDFWQKEIGDRYYATDDRVQFSPNGQNWYTLVSLNSSNSASFYQHHTINLDAAVAAAGVAYTRDFQIRFSQDNYYLASGGFAFDDIRVSQLDLTGPRITAKTPAAQVPAPLNSFTVTFSEPIDPATFTASDVVITSPTGESVEAQDPIDSGDQRTFTVPIASSSLIGNYALKIGPDVLDRAGNLMNQDNDGLNGEATSDQYSSSITLGPAPSQAFPYAQGMEVATLAALEGWRFVTTNSSIDLTGERSPHSGSKQLRMTSTSSSATAEAILVLNLLPHVGATNLSLDFWMQQLDATSGHNGSIQVSNNGTSWLYISGGVSLVAPAPNQWVHYAYDLDTALTANGITFDSDVYIKFSQTASTSGRALTFDDIRINALDVFGPRVSSLTSSSPTSFTLQFNEAIDPATFTASDLVVTGPAGYVTALAGDPVPSADNKSFTVQLAAPIAGTYRVDVGVGIQDLSGNALNSDNDPISGEAGDTYPGTLFIGAPAAQTVPLAQGFESGSLVNLPGWSFNTTGPGTTDVINTGNPAGGAYHLRFDTTGNATQQAILSLDLSAYASATNLSFDFWLQSQVVLSGSNMLDVTFSGTSASSGFSGPSSLSVLISTALDTYTHYTVDLDAVLAAQNVAIDNTVFIRFQHWGSVANARMLVDDIRIGTEDVFGPKVSSNTPLTPDGTFTVTFNEPVDPATFTASDVVVSGPTGFIMPLAGNPVPNADNRTFTLSLLTAITGAHTFRLASDIRDLAGNWLNQDGDNLNGELNADQYNGTFTIGPPVAQAFPYFQDFEGGSIGALPGMSFSFSNGATTELTSTDNPRGNHHLKFSQASSGTQTVVLLMNLAGQAGATDLVLDFWVQSLVASSTLTVAVSNAGVSYTNIAGGTVSANVGSYTQFAFDLDAALAAASVPIDDTVYIRFSRTGSGNQVMTLDDLRISNADLVGPRVLSHVLSSSSSAIALTFNEAIDANSVSASDIVAKGPTGASVSLAGVPTLSADQKTITFPLASTLFGVYTFSAGDLIRDLAGNLMNQDNDGRAGEGSQDRYSGVFTLVQPTPATLPFTETFEGGTLEALGPWSFTVGTSNPKGLIELLNASAPRSGSYHLKFDQLDSSGVSQATLSLDLSNKVGATDLALDFWIKTLNDNSASNALAVAVSGDGAAWTNVPLASALTPVTLGVYTQYIIDFDAALAGGGIAFDNSVYLRFSHSGGADTYEMVLDDVRVSQLDLSGPRLIAQPTTTPTSSLTITFNEPINPATFTAADVIITGPLGAAVPLTGNPVPSADNRSFTLNLSSGIPGNYTLRIGPDVRDAAGNIMNQDNDLLVGEANSDDDYEGAFQIGPPAAQAFPYFQGFESGSLDNLTGLGFSITSTGTMEVASINSPYSGAYHLKFDQTGSSSSSQQVNLVLDLTSQVGATNLTLDFWAQALNGTSGNTITVQVSGDGIAWSTVSQASQIALPAISQYTHYAFDFDAALASAGIALDAGVWVRFIHDGTSTSSELTLDDIRISNVDVLGPRIISSTSTLSGSFTVTFSEDINPATFTSADITVTGPTGYPVSLLAEPTTTDNRTFTLAVASTLLGTYSYFVGPGIADPAGNAMNQDNDPLVGEASDRFSGSFKVGPAIVQAFPYFQDFEGGGFSQLPGISTATTGTGTIDFVTSNAPRDSYHLKFDQASSGTQEVVLVLDLSSQVGATNLALDFWLKTLVASSSLTLSVSGNGTSYSSTATISPPSLNQYIRFAFDLDAYLQQNSVALDQDVYIKFSHTGNNANQEMTLDDIRISIADVFGPKVTSSTATSASPQIVVTFNEEIDPATFTAADVIVTGPTGQAVVLTGNPVPTAGNQSFTINLTQSLFGSYSLTIGPDVRDLAGNLMNQNGGSLSGEANDKYTGTFMLAPQVPQAFPYVENFESGSLTALAGWSYIAEPSTFLDVSSSNAPRGNYHLRMENTISTSGAQYATLALNLQGQAGATDLTFDFWLQSYGTSTIGESLYVYVSGNGVNFSTITGGFSITPSAINQYTHYAFDLDEVLQEENVAIDGDVYIRFRHFAANSNYKMSIDDVRISNADVFGPRVLSTTAGADSFIVNFSEAVDPATLTAGDITVRGPHGLTVPIIGDPVPSTDQRTFTFNLSTAVTGQHTITLATDVRDLAGNLMNQDNDTISGEATGDSYTGTFTLGPPLPQTIPYEQGFESGTLTALPGWTFGTTTTGFLSVVGEHNPRSGAKQLKFDQTASGETSAVLVLNLLPQASATDLALDFWVKSLSSSATLSLQVSGDGVSWRTPTNSSTSSTVNEFRQYSFDLDAILAANGIAIDGDVYIRFLHFGSDAANEITLDDVRVSQLDLFGPRVAAQTANISSPSFNVVFSEAVDATTFTAADVVITGPLGSVVPLIGDPVPSADQKTFTLTMASSVVGTYAIKIGPNVTDFAGNVMNQNDNPLNGESGTLDAYSGTLKLGPQATVAFPYQQDFEAGSFDALAGWSFSVTNTGNISIVDTDGPRGAYHLKFDQTTSSYKEANLLVDLAAQAGRTDLTLDFWIKAVGTSSTLFVALSGDGVTYAITGSITPSVLNQYARGAFDLDAALVGAGIAPDSDVYVRFYQSAGGVPTKLLLDDIRISTVDTIGPRVTSQMLVNNANWFTVTFNEPVDPATFTAADVTVSGPLGLAVPLAGDPIPSADFRTYTLNLASTVGGNYLFSMESDIRDFAGNGMNQDNDPLSGETNSQDRYTGSFQFGPGTPQQVPYQQSFEGADLALAGWTYAVTGSGKIDLTSTLNPIGAKHLLFDQTSTAAATQQAILALDLSNQISATDLSLDFLVQAVQSVASNQISVALSGDGATWSTIPTLNLVTLSIYNTYTHFAVDLDAALAAASIVIDGTVYVRFQHNSPTATTRMTLDDVRIDHLDLFGPRVISQTTVSQSPPTFSVTFDEPIDPATFTAADVMVVGPHGQAIPMVGNPVSSTNQRTFTIELSSAITGSHSIRIQSDVRDFAGNAMNQDNDALMGEAVLDDYYGTFVVGPAVAQPFPYMQDFEGGTYELPGWTYSTVSATIELTSADNPRGAAHLKFDQNPSGSKQMTLVMDLSSQVGATNLFLDFWLQTLNTLSMVVIEVSGNGLSFLPLPSGGLQPGFGQYLHYAFDLDAGLASSSIALDSDVYIRFSHTANSATQEATIDDVRISSADVSGPKILSHAPTGLAPGPISSFTVTFDEAIDASTFTASDIVLTGPDGIAIPITSDPVPSADNRTFTIAAPMTLLGNYVFRVGPEIFDLAGNPMNTDGDILAGETNGADDYDGTLQLGPPPAQTLPYVQGFDVSGLTDLAGWSFAYTATGTTVISNAVPYLGSGQLRFSQTGGTSTKDAMLRLDLTAQAGATDLTLDVWAQQIGSTSSNSITFYVSGDGTTWKSVSTLNPGTINRYTHYVFDLDQALAGIALDSDVYVRFAHSGLFSTNAFHIDQLRIKQGPLNNAPTLTTISNQTGVTEDVEFTITHAMLLAAGDEADTNGDTLQFRIDSVSANGVLRKNGVPVDPLMTLLGTGESLTWTPALNLNGTLDGFTVRAYDGDLVSGNAILARFVVAAANDAPVFTSAGPLLVTATEDVSSGLGIAINILVPTGMISDVDAGALAGIAIIAKDSSHGVWEYSINSGSSWQPILSIGLLLNRDSATRVRFTSSPNFNGTITSGLTIRGWDRTQYTNGSIQVISAFGGTSPFSSETATVDVSVTPQNDQPVLDSETLSMPAIQEDDATNQGMLVADLLASGGNPITDVDEGALEGIAFTGSNTILGTWQYSTDGGSSWQSMGIRTYTSARLLAADALTRVRLVPGIHANGSATFGFKAWDRTVGSNGSLGDTTTGTSFSSVTGTARQQIVPVGDTPVAPPATISEDGGFIPLLIARHAADGDEITHFIIGAITNGKLYRKDLVTEIVAGQVLSKFEVADGIRFRPAPDFYGTATYSVAASEDGVTVAAQSAYAVGNVTVQPTGDAPSAPATVTTLEDTPSELIVIGRAPQDGPEVTHFRITGIEHGTLQHSDGRTIANNAFITLAEAQAGVRFLPEQNYSGSYLLRVSSSLDGVNAQGTSFILMRTTAVNDQPQFIYHTLQDVPSNVPGFVLGTLNVYDIDFGDTHTFTISDPRFEWSNGNLQLKSDASLNFITEPQVVITVTATDAEGLSVSKEIEIDVISSELPPLFISLSSHELIARSSFRSPNAIAVWGFDPNPGDVLTWQVSDDRFEILDGLLRVVPDRRYEFEELALVTIAITATDGGGLSLTEVFAINVIADNEAPQSISVAVQMVPENARGAVVGAISIFDPDQRDGHRLSVSDDRFEVSDGLLRLKAGERLDYEAQATLSLSVTATDMYGASVNQTLAVQVEDRPEDPTQLRLSRQIVWNDLPGAWVGTLAVMDPDRANAYAYRVDDPRFEIRDGQLYLRADKALPAGEHPMVTVQVEDLETGAVLASSLELDTQQAPSDWQAAHQWRPNSFDVNADGQITPLDALLVINRLNSQGPRRLDQAVAGTRAPEFLDVSGDELLTPLDALLVINRLNAASAAEGEAAASYADDVDAALSDHLHLMAIWNALEDE